MARSRPKQERQYVNPTDAHFEELTKRVPSRRLKSGERYRHTIVQGEIDGSIEDLVAFGLAEGFRIFPDANVAIQSCWEPLWPTLLAGRPRSCVFSEPVLRELEPWLFDPWHQRERSNAIRRSLQGLGTRWAMPLGMRAFPESYARSFGYYVSLLGVRREVAIPSYDGTDFFGKAYDACTLMGEIARTAGARGVLFAKKGREDYQRHGSINRRDDQHVAIAFAHAIATGVPTMIVSGDQDVYDSTFKLQHFLDMHYRAWRVAGLLKQGAYGASTSVEAPDYRWPFEGSADVYDRISDEFDEAMPAQYRSTPVTTLFLAPGGRIFFQTVHLVHDLRPFLWTKSETAGRNTSLFASRNVHVATTLLHSSLHGKIILAKDAESPSGFRDMQLSELDVNIAINSFDDVVPVEFTAEGSSNLLIDSA